MSFRPLCLLHRLLLFAIPSSADGWKSARRSTSHCLDSTRVRSTRPANLVSARGSPRFLSPDFCVYLPGGRARLYPARRSTRLPCVSARWMGTPSPSSPPKCCFVCPPAGSPCTVRPPSSPVGQVIFVQTVVHALPESLGRHTPVTPPIFFFSNWAERGTTERPILPTARLWTTPQSQILNLFSLSTLIFMKH